MDDNALSGLETIWVRVAERLGIEPMILLSAIASETLKAGWLGSEPPGRDAKSRGLSIHEVAERLGVSADLVRDEIAAGRLVARRVGRRVLIPSSEIERILVAGGSLDGTMRKTC